jgi:adenylate cyclase
MPSSAQRIERKLAAIFAADVAGYTRLMGHDEVATLMTLAAHREIMDRLIGEHRGRIANTAGDSVLAEFPSVVNAVQCAVEVQQALADANEVVPEDRRMSFRIGVHVGDVMVRGADLLGDGVNVAARLQALSAPGGVCLSGEAHQYARKVLPFDYEDLGHRAVRNIEEPIRVFRVASIGQQIREAKPSSGQRLPLPDKPSIAVMPFTNMSGDPEQEYFADGIVEDIITALSRLRWLFVIARNSSFTYKGRAVDVKQVGRELGVRYVLEGSVRRAATHVRITAQLVDTLTGGHHWAERYDRDLVDVFELQDDITRNVAAAIEPRLLAAEGMRSLHRSPDDLGGWELVARALGHFWRFTRLENEIAIARLTQAGALYPDYAPAHSLLACSLVLGAHVGWIDPQDVLARAWQHARRAVELDENDAWVHIALGYLALMEHRTEEAIGAFRHATELNPNSATAHGFLGRGLAFAGHDQEAIAHCEKAIRLSPNDPQVALFLGPIGIAHFLAGRFDQAVEVLTKSSKLRPGLVSVQRLLCASLAQADRLDEAQTLLKSIREQQPNLSIDWLRRNVPLQNAELMERFLSGIRKAGLPE